MFFLVFCFCWLYHGKSPSLTTIWERNFLSILSKSKNGCWFDLCSWNYIAFYEMEYHLVKAKQNWDCIGCVQFMLIQLRLKENNPAPLDMANWITLISFNWCCVQQRPSKVKSTLDFWWNKSLFRLRPLNRDGRRLSQKESLLFPKKTPVQRPLDD